MHRMLRFWVSHPGLAAFATALIVSTASAADASASISLVDAYRAAVKNTEPVAIEQARQVQTSERVSEARSGLLPNLSLNAGYLRQQTPDSAYTGGSTLDPNQSNARLTALQPLFRGFR